MPGSTYQKHKEDDKALATPTDGDSADNSTNNEMSIFRRLVLFLGFPFLVGFLGLYTAYIDSKSHDDRTIRIETDFALPFVMALSMVVVLWIQTNGFRSKKPEPLIAWPKAVKKKRIVHKHVVVQSSDDEGDTKKKN